jgi:hypothetical protein
VDVKVEEVDCTSRSWGLPLPLEPGSYLTKRVHCFHEVSISMGSVTLDDIHIVNQPAVKDRGNVGLKKYCFLVVAVVYGSLAAIARGAHSCAIRLF